MKRDWDLVRTILLAVEDAPPSTVIGPEKFSGADKAMVFEHVRLLTDAGYLDAHLLPNKTGAGGGHFMIRDMKWDGQDLLAKMRSESWWSKIKAISKEKGLDLTFEVIKTYALPAAAEILGLPST